MSDAITGPGPMPPEGGPTSPAGDQAPRAGEPAPSPAELPPSLAGAGEQEPLPAGEGPDLSRPGLPEAQPAAPAPRPRRTLWRFAAVGLAAGVAGAALTAGAFLLWFDGQDPAPATGPGGTQVAAPAGQGAGAAAVARAVLPSIVTVQVRASDVGDFVVEGSGSGVVLRADGLLVTNEHVVEGAGQVRVIFADGRIYPAEIVGQDAATDLAVLRISATGLTPITLGSSDAMEIGDTAIAVGSPLGLEGGPSVTVGVLSAFNRRVGTGADELFGMIQTDAPITRGSSGGALVDSAGRLIGITTAIGVSDVGAEGLGFAIPVELVRIVTDQLAESGVAGHPFIGIKGTTFFRRAADGASVPAGVEVAEIIAGTAAELAGLQAGDVIRSVDGEPLNTMEQLVVLVRLHRVGDQVTLEIERGGRPQVVTVTLLERPEGL